MTLLYVTILDIQAHINGDLASGRPLAKSGAKSLH